MSGPAADYDGPMNVATGLDEVMVSWESDSETGEALSSAHYNEENDKDRDNIDGGKGSAESTSHTYMPLNPSKFDAATRNDEMPDLQTDDLAVDNDRSQLHAANVSIRDDLRNDFDHSTANDQVNSNISNELETNLLPPCEDGTSLLISVDECHSECVTNKVRSKSEDFISYQNVSPSSPLENKENNFKTQKEPIPTFDNLPESLKSMNNGCDERNKDETYDKSCTQEKSKRARQVLFAHLNDKECSENSNLLSSVADETAAQIKSGVSRRQGKPRACSNIRRIQEKLQDDLKQNTKPDQGQPFRTKEHITKPSTSSSLNYVRRQRSRSRASTYGRTGSSLIQRPYRRWLTVSTNTFTDPRFIVTSSKKTYACVMCKNKSSVPLQNPSQPNEKIESGNETTAQGSEVKANLTSRVQTVDNEMLCRSPSPVLTSDLGNQDDNIEINAKMPDELQKEDGEFMSSLVSTSELRKQNDNIKMNAEMADELEREDRESMLSLVSTSQLRKQNDNIKMNAEMADELEREDGESMLSLVSTSQLEKQGDNIKVNADMSDELEREDGNSMHSPVLTSDLEKQGDNIKVNAEMADELEKEGGIVMPSPVSTRGVEKHDDNIKMKSEMLYELESKDDRFMPSTSKGESCIFTEETKDCSGQNTTINNTSKNSPTRSNSSLPVESFTPAEGTRRRERRRRSKHRRHRHAHRKEQRSQTNDIPEEEKAKPLGKKGPHSLALSVIAENDSFRQDGGLAGKVISVPTYEFENPPPDPSLSDEERRGNDISKAVPFDGTHGLHPLREELKQYAELGLAPPRARHPSRSMTLEKLIRKSWKKEDDKPEYYHVQAVCDFDGKLPGQLSFRKGQVIKQLDTGLLPKNGMSYGYYKAGRLRRKRAGLYPCSYVTCQVDD